MNDDNDVLVAARDSLAGVRMRRPVEGILRAGRARQRRRRLTTGTALAVATIAAVTGVALAVPGASPGGAPDGGRAGTAATVEIRQVGFTLQVNQDGSVDFTVTDVLDPAAATAALNNAGIAGKVLLQTTGCPRFNDEDIAVWPPRPRPSSTPPPDGFISGERTVTLRSSFYPQGGGLLVLVELRQRPWGPWAAVVWFGYADVNKIPACVDIRDPGTY